jgi:hypothetical protein
VDDRAGALGRVHDLVRRAIQHLVVVRFHPNADALVTETRQGCLPKFPSQTCCVIPKVGKR